jgi:hypothetical protein
MSFIAGKSNTDANDNELNPIRPGVYTFPSAGSGIDSCDDRSLSYKPSHEPFLESESPKIKTPSSQGNYLYNWWLWEIVSICFSVVCLACIILVLLIFDNKPIPSLPAGFTFNALVSLLATLSKAAMLVTVAACISQLKWHWFGKTRKMRDFEMFDQASRGPWGALFLIARTRSPWLVGLGAIITVVALGVEPFMQQIISFTTTPVGISVPATVSRAQTYDAGASLGDCKYSIYLPPHSDSLRSIVYQVGISKLFSNSRIQTFQNLEMKACEDI